MFSTDAQALMEAAVDAIIVIDHRGRIQAVNDSACRIFGFPTHELLGENVSILMSEPHRSAHDGYMANYLATGKAKIIGIGRQVTARRKDGSTFPASLSVGRVPHSEPPRFVGLVRDITSEVEATNALKLERDRSNAYLELNDAILVSLDADARVREVNARGSQLLGAAAPEIVGRDWLSFMRDEPERARARLLLESALASGASREREFDAVDATGAPRRIYWRCIARRATDGTPAGWLCSGDDVTERVRREENNHLAQQRLTRVARLATMGEIASGVAHELNQPLTAITTFARACDRYLDQPEPDLPEVRLAVREIAAEGMRAGKIITRLRQIVRTDGDDERDPVDLNALVAELRPMLEADARLYETRLDFGLAAQLPPVRAHYVQLQQVVLNLVRNAFEALAERGAPDRTVQIVTARTAQGDVEIRVTDNGPGIAAAIADRLFDPFATTKRDGTGLGLSISRTIVQAHGGNIGVRAVAPHGATFYVQLPEAEEGAR
jgi:two-component system, LuxR family, sensor kinase FixL